MVRFHLYPLVREVTLKMVVLKSIQGEQYSNTDDLANIKCRALRHSFDGGVFQELRNHKVVWVAKLECPRCGTHRTDVLVPLTCELISRTYDHPNNYDGMMSPSAARRILYKKLLSPRNS